MGVEVVGVDWDEKDTRGLKNVEISVRINDADRTT